MGEVHYRREWGKPKVGRPTPFYVSRLAHSLEPYTWSLTMAVASGRGAPLYTFS